MFQAIPHTIPFNYYLQRSIIFCSIIYSILHYSILFYFITIYTTLFHIIYSTLHTFILFYVPYRYKIFEKGSILGIKIKVDIKLSRYRVDLFIKLRSIKVCICRRETEVESETALTLLHATVRRVVSLYLHLAPSNA